MFCNVDGTPNASGQYELRDGKLQRRAGQWLGPGDHIGFDINLVDAASRSSLFLTDSYQHFTDAERAFADSAEGQMIAAKAMSDHRRRNAWMGDRAPAFTESMRAAAIKKTVSQRDGSQALLDKWAADEPRLRAEMEAAQQRCSASRRARYLNR